MVLEAIKTGGTGQDKTQQTAANLYFTTGLIKSIGEQQLAQLEKDRGPVTVPSLPGSAPAVNTTSGDDRVLVENTNVLPWSAVCHITLTGVDGSQWLASGCLISPRVVLTAGYVVYQRESGRYFKQAEVSPGRSGEQSPYGTQVSQRLLASQRVLNSKDWVDNEYQGDDYGVIILPKPFPGAGTLQTASQPDSMLAGEEFVLAGYPSDRRKGTMWAVRGRVIGLSSETIKYRAHNRRDSGGAHPSGQDLA